MREVFRSRFLRLTLVAMLLTACARYPLAVPAHGELGFGRGPVLPVAADVPASASVTPAPFERIPFTYGASATLAVYDDATHDVLVFPGAGYHLENPFELNPYEFYFDDAINIYFYDATTEERLELVDGREVGGFAFSPAFDNQNDLYFLGTDNAASASLKIGLMYAKTAPVLSASESSTPYPLDPYLGTLRNLSAINAVAEQHGGITSNNVDGSGEHIVFTTTDGGLYLYETRRQRVQALLPDAVVTGAGSATGANIDPVWGRFVVWEDTRRRSLYVLDHWTGLIDALPYARIASNLIEASAPNYYGSDPYDVVFTATLADGTMRLFVYDTRTETVRALTVLNAFSAESQVPATP